MVALPAVYLNAGWLPASVLLIVTGLCSGFGGGFLIEAMGRLPGNEHFDQRGEMMYLAKKVMGVWAYRLTIVLFVVRPTHFRYTHDTRGVPYRGGGACS